MSIQPAQNLTLLMDKISATHSHFNKVIFVPTSQLPGSFDLTLIEQKNHAPVTFNVPLQGP